MSKSIVDLDQGDVDGAVSIFRERVLTGRWSSDAARIMFQVVADDRLADAIELASAEPAIAAKLAELEAAEQASLADES